MLLLVRVLLDNNEIEKAGEELNKLVMMLQEEKVDDYNEELFLLGIIEWCRGHLKDAQDSMRGYAPSIRITAIKYSVALLSSRDCFSDIM